MVTRESGRPGQSPESKERILPRRLVVKFGTQSLCNEGRLDQELFNDFARQIVELQRQGVEVIVVSSGAKQTGEEEAKNRGIDINKLNKKALTGLGQPKLMNRWDRAIKEAGDKGAAQLLVTYTNWSNEKENKNVVDTIFSCLNAGITPILNENDPVSDQEIILWEKGISENDRLAGLVARRINADAVLFLTDEGGIYTDDPKRNPEARQFAEIPTRYKKWGDESYPLWQIFKGKIKDSIQGMGKKWSIASSCSKQGMRVAIAGVEHDVITRFAEGEPVGTRIGTIARLKQ